jgi:hypothetical protein
MTLTDLLHFCRVRFFTVIFKFMKDLSKFLHLVWEEKMTMAARGARPEYKSVYDHDWPSSATMLGLDGSSRQISII